MRIILKPRQGGKTYDMIQMSAILNVPIVTVDNHRASYVENMARNLRILIPKPIAATRLKALRWGHNQHEMPKDVLIDDADAVIRALFEEYGVRPIAMAMTQHDFE